MIDAILRFSVAHRWLVLALAVAVAGLGLYSAARLPIDAVPDITNNQVQINTLAPSLSPAEVEKQVTFPIETALAGIPGLVSTRSLSRNGFSQVTAVFDDDVDIYFARQQVSERLAEAKESMPEGAEPKMGPISTGLGEIAMWSVELVPPGEGAPVVRDGEPGWQPDGSYLTPEGERLRTEVERATYLRTVQDWIVRPQLKGVPGVAGIDAIGGFSKEIQVQPDPTKLSAYGLSLSNLIEALERNNASTGAGYVEHHGESFLVKASGRLSSIEDIEQVVVALVGGVPVRVIDVATVGVGKELRTGSASQNGREVVVGTALMLIGENSRTVASRVADRLEVVSRSLPPSVRVKLVLNREKLVDATIATVEKNLLEGAILVVVVLLLLLGNVRGAIVTALVIPLAMLMTFTAMVRTKVGGNLMSLGAIDFGMIVDGGVIVVENCLRKQGDKQHALGRALTREERAGEVLAACREMARPSLFGGGIILMVFVPVLFLTGIEGKMFRPMALTILYALVSAFILSLTVVPALVAIVMAGRVSEKENLLVRAAKRLYTPALSLALRGRVVVAGVALAAFAGGLVLFRGLGQEFVPTLDEQDVALQVVRIPSTSLTTSQQLQLQVERAVSALPEVDLVFSKTGTAEMASDPMPPNATDTFVVLKPRSKWPDPRADKAALVARIEAAVQVLPGNAFEITQPIQMRFNELIAGVRGDLAIKVHGDDFDAMRKTADKLARVLGTVPGAADIKVEQTEGLPVMDIAVDRRAASRYGLDVASVQDVVATAIGGRRAGQVFEGDRRFPIVVRLPEPLRRDPDAVARLPLPVRSREAPARDGEAHAAAFIPLDAVAKVAVTEGANQISRENGKRRVVVQANVRGRDLGSFVAEVQSKAASVELPPGGYLQWGGQFENLTAARSRLLLVVPLCLVVVFGLLFALFGSVRDALIVSTGVPLALTGGIVALFVRSIPFSISAAVGFIALSGVAVLNGVVMVSFIRDLRGRGVPFEQAIVEGSLARLRPVLMTALVASLGFVPMALATGTGAEVQRPLATVVIGGIVSSTLLTLVVLPALYRMFGAKGGEGAAALDRKIEDHDR